VGPVGQARGWWDCKWSVGPLKDNDGEEQNQPKRPQASVAPDNLTSSLALSAGTEAGSESAESVEEYLADRHHNVITNEGKDVFSSQVSCEGEDMEYEPE